MTGMVILSNIYVKIDTHVRSITNYDNICIAEAIRELCEARDSGVPQFVDATQHDRYFVYQIISVILINYNIYS